MQSIDSTSTGFGLKRFSEYTSTFSSVSSHRIYRRYKLVAILTHETLAFNCELQTRDTCMFIAMPGDQYTVYGLPIYFQNHLACDDIEYAFGDQVMVPDVCVLTHHFVFIYIITSFDWRYGTLRPIPDQQEPSFKFVSNLCLWQWIIPTGPLELHSV